ncbi:heavy-metal-associated domain-containing protein [Kitasatospora sp. NPDC097691]|uniref:heavy-metal-associated domain-containing protein n=1 Tax=Kitasatospora sp. NPDC097691 TaxID=3157231 RepID=UPI00331E7243
MSETTLTVESTTAAASSCCGSCGTDATAAMAGTAALTSVFQVKGMTCGHCVTSVTAELTKIDGVTDVAVDLASGRVTVGSTRPLADTDVAAAVDEAGYDLVGRLDG